MRPAALAGVALLAVAFLAWVVWAGLGAARTGADGEVTGFRILGPGRIEVDVRLRGPAGEVSCTVEALDSSRGVVGVTQAAARVGTGSAVRTTVTVRTRARAVTAVVDGCVTAGR